MYTVFVYGKAEDVKRREENLEEAKKITIEEDSTLPPAKKVTQFCTKSFLNWSKT